MCGVQLKDGKGGEDLMSMLGLNETIDQLATNCNQAANFSIARIAGKLVGHM